jgi:hypothetical protein
MLCVVCVLVIYFIYMNWRTESLIGRPTESIRHSRMEDVLKHTSVFEHGRNYQDAKYMFDWMDPVVYDKIRKLYKANKLNTKNMIRDNVM